MRAGSYKVLAIIAVILIVGCTWSINPTHKYQLSIDLTTLSREQASVVVDAANDWQLATNNYIMFFTSTDYLPIWTDQTDNVITITGQPSKQIEARNNGAIGYCARHGEPSSIVLANDVDNVYLKRLSLHEIGHAIGLQHTGPNTIMSPWMDCDNDMCADQHITCTDVSQLCFVWDKIGCDAPDMPACQFQSDAAPPEPTFPPQKPMPPNKYELVQPIKIKEIK